MRYLVMYQTRLLSVVEAFEALTPTPLVLEGKVLLHVWLSTAGTKQSVVE